MGIPSVNQTNGVQGNQPVPSSTAPVGENDTLFEEEEGVKQVDEAQKTVLEARIAKLEQEIKELEAQKAQKQAEKAEITPQRNALNAQKEKIEKEVKANESLIKQYSDEMTSYNQEIQKEKEQVEKLKKQYDAKNKEAMELSEKLNEKIAQVIEESNNNIKAQREQISQASAEASQKVQSGEISEDEVAQYIMNRLGSSTAGNGSENAFSEINSMSKQVKSLISDASGLLANIAVRETKINKFSAQITSGNTAINDLKQKNTQKNKQIGTLNNEIAVYDKDISSIDSEISGIDTKITKNKIEIVETQNEISGKATGGKGSATGTTNTPTVETPIAGGNNQNTNTTHDNKKEETGDVTNNANPFASVAYDKVSYSSVVDALDAISKDNDKSIESAKTQVTQNKQEMRKLFQDILK